MFQGERGKRHVPKGLREHIDARGVVVARAPVAYVVEVKLVELAARPARREVAERLACGGGETRGSVAVISKRPRRHARWARCLRGTSETLADKAKGARPG